MSRRATSLALAAAGLLANALLLGRSLGASTVAGCGGGGCDAALASGWSHVAGAPVAALGVVVYVGLIAAIAWRKSPAIGYCCAAISGAAIWMIFVQAICIGSFCPWCMTAHAIGLATAATALPPVRSCRAGLLAGVGSVGLLAGFQTFGPAPVTHRIDSGPIAQSGDDLGIHAAGDGRKVAFDGGNKIYDTRALPGLGAADAPHVLVEYFDYQCPACRKMAGFLEALLAKHPSHLRVLMLPVPLERPCNALLPPDEAGHPGSCELAKIALAVWRIAPAHFPEVHRALLAEPPPAPESARHFAGNLVGPAKLAEALRDPWLDAVLQADIHDWDAFSAKSRQLPKLLIRDRRILHGLPSSEADFVRVMENELGL